MKKLFFVGFVAIFFLQSCKQSVEMPPVYAIPHLGFYLIPGCGSYDKAPTEMRLTLKTVQEAELSGYVPARTCAPDLIAKRITDERENYGEIKLTPEMEHQKQQLLNRKLERIQSDIEDRADESRRRQEDIESEQKKRLEDLKDKQEEMERQAQEKQREMERKVRELEDKNDELELNRKY